MAMDGTKTIRTMYFAWSLVLLFEANMLLLQYYLCNGPDLCMYPIFYVRVIYYVYILNAFTTLYSHMHSRFFQRKCYIRSLLIVYSDYDFPNVIWYIIPQREITVKISTFIPIIIFGILGNVILLNVIIRNKALQTPTNMLLANMAVADFLVLTICPIMFMLNDFYQNFLLGTVGCKIEGYLQGALLFTAVFNLCAATYERFTAIVLPKQTRLTVFGTKIVMASTWVIGFILAVPLAVHRIYKERQWKNFLETYCMENKTILDTYWHVIISFIVWFPLGAMIICYTAIYWKLHRHEVKVNNRENPISVSYKMKVAITLFIVVVTFIVLRLPFTSWQFIRSNLLKKSQMNQAVSFQTLSYVSQYLIFLNAAINPIIYGLTNDAFKRAYHQTPLFPCLSKGKNVQQ